MCGTYSKRHSRLSSPPTECRLICSRELQNRGDSSSKAARPPLPVVVSKSPPPLGHNRTLLPRRPRSKGRGWQAWAGSWTNRDNRDSNSSSKAGGLRLEYVLFFDQPFGTLETEREGRDLGNDNRRWSANRALAMVHLFTSDNPFTRARSRSPYLPYTGIMHMTHLLLSTLTRDLSFCLSPAHTTTGCITRQRQHG